MTRGVEPLGILGGTFDPVHVAHLRLAQEARARLGLSGVLWLPAGRPPHRPPPRASAEHRLAMLRLALGDRADNRIDEAELRAVVPSYTVPTLERLRREQGEERPLVLLLGADAFLNLPGWYRWRNLFSLAHLAVATRPGFSLDPAAMPKELSDEFRPRAAEPAALADAPAGRIVTFPLSAGTASSTEVRERLARGDAVGALLAPAVVDYIAAHSLYRPEP